MFDKEKTVAQRLSWVLVWIMGAGTAVMMVACGTLFYATYSDNKVFRHDIVTEVLVVTILTYLGLLVASIIASRMNQKVVL